MAEGYRIKFYILKVVSFICQMVYEVKDVFLFVEGGRLLLLILPLVLLRLMVNNLVSDTRLNGNKWDLSSGYFVLDNSKGEMLTPLTPNFFNSLYESHRLGSRLGYPWTGTSNTNLTIYWG